MSCWNRSPSNATTTTTTTAIVAKYRSWDKGFLRGCCYCWYHCYPMLLLLFQSGYLLRDTPRQKVIDLDSWIEYDSGVVIGHHPNDELTSANSQLIVKVATQ